MTGIFDIPEAKSDSERRSESEVRAAVFMDAIVARAAARGERRSDERCAARDQRSLILVEFATSRCIMRRFFAVAGPTTTP
jgi:hypothetical protein